MKSSEAKELRRLDLNRYRFDKIVRNDFEHQRGFILELVDARRAKYREVFRNPAGPAKLKKVIEIVFQ